MGRPGNAYRTSIALVAIAAASVVLEPAAGGKATPEWTMAAKLTTARYAHTATLLPSGQVLVAGGERWDHDKLDNVILASAELYDPVANTWSAAADMSQQRVGATATMLPGGKVLVAGGNSGYLANPVLGAELYDPASNTWTPAGTLGTGRSDTAAVLLGNGKVLLAGGYGTDKALRSAELYDPAANSWSPAASMSTTRDQPASTALADGRALLIGGHSPGPPAPAWGVTRTAEVYDPATDRWSKAAAPSADHFAATATLLPSGRVLLVGGTDGYYGRPLTAAELYDPATDTWSPAGRMRTGRAFHTATLLADGRVLVTGGQVEDAFDTSSDASAELYDPASNSWSSAGNMAHDRFDHTATLLTNDKVLIVGGRSGPTANDPDPAWRSVELYTPAPGRPFTAPLVTFPAGPVTPSGPTGPLSPITMTSSTLNAGPVAFAPSARPHTCVYAKGDNGMRPMAAGCVRMEVGLAPVFAPDGRMLYMATGSRDHRAVFARDPETGALTQLPCATASGGTRCPPGSEALVISPDGAWLYGLNAHEDQEGRQLYVFARAADGTLTPVRCLGDALNPDPTCEALLPPDLGAMQASADFTSLYLAGKGMLVKLDRDPATGALALSDCLSASAQDGCRTDASLGGLGKIAVAGNDVYVYSDGGTQPGARVIGFRPDPADGKLVTTGSVRGITIGDLAPAPDGTRMYGVPRGRTELLAFPRDPATGQLGPATCYAARAGARASRTGCVGYSGGYSAASSVAVSPDGKTALTTGWYYSGCNHCGTVGLPGAEGSSLVTYHATNSGGMRASGCVGDLSGCAPPAGLGQWIRYPPNGAGPYYVSQQRGLTGVQLLTPAPTLRLRAMTVGGRNRATITCPRSRPCRGRIVIDLESYSYLGTDFHHLQRLRYRAAAGATKPISLRLTRRAQRRVQAIVAGNEHDPKSDVFIVIRVFDGSGAATPTGISTCLRHVGCALGAALPG